MVEKKKRFYNFFFISLYKYRLETINWFMNNSLSILLSGVKFALHLVHFMINFELQLQEATKFFSYFDFGLLEWRIVKNHARDFWLRFYFLRYWPILVSFEMSTINRKFFITKTAQVLKNRGYGFAQRLFPEMYTAFKGITP